MRRERSRRGGRGVGGGEGSAERAPALPARAGMVSRKRHRWRYRWHPAAVGAWGSAAMPVSVKKSAARQSCCSAHALKHSCTVMGPTRCFVYLTPPGLSSQLCDRLMTPQPGAGASYRHAQWQRVRLCVLLCWSIGHRSWGIVGPCERCNRASGCSWWRSSLAHAALLTPHSSRTGKSVLGAGPGERGAPRAWILCSELILDSSR